MDEKSQHTARLAKTAGVSGRKEKLLEQIWISSCTLLHSTTVAKHILPIYEDLSKEELLQRCLGDYTQNANGSFNSTIWRLARKHLNSGLKIVEIASYIAARVFTKGYSSIL